MQWYALIRNLDRAAEQSAYRKTHKQRQTCLYFFWIWICICSDIYLYLFRSCICLLKSWSNSRAECIGKHTNRGRQEPNLEKRVGLGPAQINTHTKLENTSTQINTNVNTTHIFTQAPWRLQDFNDRLFGNLGSCEWPAILNNRFSWRDRIWWTLPRLLT